MQNFRQPRNDFVICQTYEEIKAIQEHERVSFLHAHGLPGSGKSEIIRKLAVEFPYSKEKNVFVKHQIDCSDSSEDIEQCLKDLLDMMHKNDLLQRNEKWKVACSRLEKKRTADYVGLLVESGVPILIIIEDPPRKDRELLADFLRSLDSAQPKDFIHVYITSKSKNIGNCEGLKHYRPKYVKGLTVSEGLQLLGLSESSSDADKKAGETIVGFLSGSPLGLIAVKAYCKKTRKSLDAYHQTQEQFPLATHRTEIEVLKEEYGPEQLHLFQCVIRLLQSKYTALWKIMSTLAVFHHGGIPQRLIGKVVQLHRPADRESLKETHANNEQESGAFIREVEDFGICSVVGKDYKSTVVSFHRVVFVAVRLHLQENGLLSSSLRDAIVATSSLVHKDVRKTDTMAFMQSMQSQIERILSFADEHPDDINDFLMKMAVAHLREILGVISQPTLQAVDSLERSAHAIWTEVNQFAQNKVDFSVLTNKQNQEVESYAKDIAEACVEAGDKLRAMHDDFNQYASYVMQFKPDELDFLLDHSSHQEIKEFLKDATVNSLGITPGRLVKYRRKESKTTIFLDMESYCRVFFVARLISILYTLGRIPIKHRRIRDNEREKFVWISDMAHALCVECLKITGTRVLFLRRSAVARVAVRLKSCSGVGHSKKGILLEAQTIMNNFLSEEMSKQYAYFENGLRKSMDNPFEWMTYLAYVVRIETKLMPFDVSDNLAEKGNSADLHYRKLYQIATENKVWQFSFTCIIYCGKYMAAKGKYLEAARHFQEALNAPWIKTDKAAMFPWACYNLTRAVVCGRLRDLFPETRVACQEALHFRDKIEDHLLSKLTEMQNALENDNNIAES